MERQIVQRDRDMLRLKLLAKKVVDERTTMQQFFIDALDQVQTEIKAARKDYVQRAKQNYSARMAAAAVGQSSPPKVKTFSTNQRSTNTVEMDMAAAEEWGNVDANTDFMHLTWEQKEKVIRLLFAKMNGVDKKTKKLPPIQKRPLSSKSSSTALSGTVRYQPFFVFLMGFIYTSLIASFQPNTESTSTKKWNLCTKGSFLVKMLTMDRLSSRKLFELDLLILHYSQIIF